MVVALHDVRKREHTSRMERSRGLADATTPRRRLIQYEGKPLIEPSDSIERRQSRFDICWTRARWDQAQIGCTYTAYGQRIVRGRSVNYHHSSAVPLEVDEGALDFYATAGTLDERFGIGAAPAPTGDRTLGVDFNYADALAILHRRNSEPYCERALAAAALLGCQYDCVHRHRPSTKIAGTKEFRECEYTRSVRSRFESSQ
jgi:hypothetical protein